GEPPGEGAPAGGRDRVRLAGSGARLAQPDVPLGGEGGQLPVHLTARHGPVRAEPPLGFRPPLTTRHRTGVKQPPPCGRRRIYSRVRHAFNVAMICASSPGYRVCVSTMEGPVQSIGGPLGHPVPAGATCGAALAWRPYPIGGVDNPLRGAPRPSSVPMI